MEINRHLHMFLLASLCIHEIVAKVKVTGSKSIIGTEFPCTQIVYKHGKRMTWSTVGS